MMILDPSEDREKKCHEIEVAHLHIDLINTTPLATIEIETTGNDEIVKGILADMSANDDGPLIVMTVIIDIETVDQMDVEY